MKGRKTNTQRTNSATCCRARGGSVPAKSEGKAAVFAAAKRDSGSNIGTICGDKSKHRADRMCGGGGMKRANGGRAGSDTSPKSNAGGGSSTSSPYSSAGKGLRSGGTC